jgi:phosphatidylinositol alpha-1,6-mannosyltransferase
MTHLLVTNDFPPKVGGIQTYLWELWRRLPDGEATVVTTAYPGAAEWDRHQGLAVRRTGGKVLLPRRGVVDHIRTVAAATGAKLVVLDPALPLGLVGPRLDLPYAVVLHGAEVTVPGRLPVSRRLLAGVLGHAAGIVAAGAYPAAEAQRAAGEGAHLPEIVQVPPGVDPARFRPLDAPERTAARLHLGLPGDGPLIVCASRLVPRKGVDVLIEATTRLVVHRPDLTVAVAGAGRDTRRLRTLAGRLGVKVRFLGRVPDQDLAALYAAADVFAMLCRDRWRGLEQEGFGIVFLEAAACGVPQVAGCSGGAAEAVVDGSTGYVVQSPRDPDAVADALRRLLDDADLRRRMGEAGRLRARSEFDWDRLAQRLGAALRRWES